MTRHNYCSDQHGWAELMAPRWPGKKLHGKHKARWAVIGAGFTGLACARRLAHIYPDDEIVILDARRVGQGASGRNAGFAVAVSQFPGAYRVEKMADYRRINRINQAGVDLLRSQIKTGSINCQWDESGFYYAAADQHAMSECQHFLRYLENMDVAHTKLDQSDFQQRLGTDHYQSGVHVPVGALLQPAQLVCGLADSLPENVTLYEQTPVLKIVDGAPLILELQGGNIRADNVFIAVNYEAEKIGFIRHRLIGSTLAGSFTRQLSNDELASLGDLQQWGVLSLHGGGATVRLTGDGRICLRNTVEYNGGALLSEQKLAARQKIHRTSFDQRFPQLSGVEFEFGWSGVEGISGNGTNFFGRQRDNIYLAGGYNGSGVSRGTAFGTALGDFASGEQSQLITDCLANDPAQWLPPRPFLDVGAAFKIASRFAGVGLDR